VLGYSDATTSELHAVCSARLARAAQEAGPDDVVLFSGWARGPRATSEADLMASSWTGTGRVRLLDRGARTTLGNAIAIARAVRHVHADEVVLVTSRWHAGRAAVLARAALVGTGAKLRVAATAEPGPHRSSVREAAAWLVVPVLAVVAARTR
jgi:uncharacterized SAM-binding protein YcdF (DUF218 family)